MFVRELRGPTVENGYRKTDNTILRQEAEIICKSRRDKSDHPGQFARYIIAAISAFICVVAGSGQAIWARPERKIARPSVVVLIWFFRSFSKLNPLPPPAVEAVCAVATAHRTTQQDESDRIKRHSPTGPAYAGRVTGWTTNGSHSTPIEASKACAPETERPLCARRAKLYAKATEIF
jgi:hypothetical protein